MRLLPTQLPDEVILGEAITGIDHKGLSGTFRRTLWYKVFYKEKVMLWVDDRWEDSGYHISDMHFWWRQPHHHRFSVYYGYASVTEVEVIKALEEQADF